MKEPEPTVYSAKCVCCGAIFLSLEPIRPSTVGLPGTVSVLGVRCVEIIGARSLGWDRERPHKLATRSECEAWLIHGDGDA